MASIVLLADLASASCAIATCPNNARAVMAANLIVHRMSTSCRVTLHPLSALATGLQHDEVWEIRRVGADLVCDLGTQTRAAELTETGVHEVLGRPLVSLVGGPCTHRDLRTLIDSSDSKSRPVSFKDAAEDTTNRPTRLGTAVLLVWSLVDPRCSRKLLQRPEGW